MNLALQICQIDNIEIDNAESSDAGGGEIKRERRSQAAGTDAKHSRLLQLELTLRADLRQQEVTRVTQNLGIAEAGERDVGRVGHESVIVVARWSAPPARMTSDRPAELSIVPQIRTLREIVSRWGER